MRQCNRDLIARVISHGFDDEDDVTSVADIDDPEAELRQRGIERRENGEMPRSAWKPSEEDREHVIEQTREGAIQEHNDNMSD